MADKIPVPDRPDKRMRLMHEPKVTHFLTRGKTPPNRYGIDVSRYQGKINWKEVKKDKRVNFVYLKATEGVGLVDPMYKRNLKGVRSVGIPVGAYHFFSPNASAKLQLANFIKTVDPRTQDLIPVIDVEVAPKKRSQIGPFLQRLRVFIKGVESHFGCKPIIYTSVNFYDDYLAGKFDAYSYMFARYANTAPRVNRKAKFLIWQFTATGRVRGISGDVDRSCLMGKHTLENIRYRQKRKRK